MGFRFQKRIRIFKGLTLNLSKSGTSWTLGRQGASVNVRDDKVTGTVGVPGTGMSYRQTLVDFPDGPARREPMSSRGRVLATVVVCVLAYAALKAFGVI